MAIIHGFLLGLIISILVGPVFLLLINTSIRYGFRAALILEIGICASDIGYIIIAWLGLGQFMLDLSFQFWMGLIGGAIILVYSISILTSKKNPLAKEPELMTTSNALGLIAKGFLLNSSNPSVIIFWFTTVGIAMKTYKGQTFDILAYFGTCIFTAFSIDLLKSYFAKKSREIINPKSYKWFKMVSGGLLFIIGCVLIIKTIKFSL